MISIRSLTREFIDSLKNVTIDKETVRKVLLNKGIGSYIAIKKPLLTVKDRLKRLNWCRERINWSVEEWSHVIFSDEAKFGVLNCKGKVYVKR